MTNVIKLELEIPDILLLNDGIRDILTFTDLSESGEVTCKYGVIGTWKKETK